MVKQFKLPNMLLSFKTFFIIAALFILIPSDTIYAFHEGGVGYCEGCHIMHTSKDRQTQGTEGSNGIGLTNAELKGSDPSSTCLLCHAEQGKFYNILSKDGSIYTPGGDFYWLKKTFTWNVDGKSFQSPGERHGHNIVAVDYGLYEDNSPDTISAGLDSSAPLGCTSCHDPHGITDNNRNHGAISVPGSYGESPPTGTIAGNYRILGGTGYTRGTNGITFKYPAPVAVMNANNWSETDSNHTAYGSGMSEWCCNCHNNFLNGNSKHPSGSSARLSNVIASHYNSYVKTGNITGIQAAAYSALVPFEVGTANISLLSPSSMSGPDPAGGSNVMCLTCHRAHASAFRYIGRWDFDTTFIADSHPKSGDSGITGNDVPNSYYGRNMVAEFGSYQRQFCNKCHLLD